MSTPDDRPADDDLPPDDDDLVARLRSIADIADPPPEFVEQAAQQALLTRRLDAELAQLLTDSAVESELLVRSDDDVRLVSLAGRSVTVDLQLTRRPDGSVALRGLVDGASGEVEAEWAGGSERAAIEEFGEFVMAGLPSVNVRFHLVATTGGRVVTEWVLL